LRILFITATRIGDAVISSGVLNHLVAKYPDARFTIACGPLAASLFAAVPRLDRVIVLRKRTFNRHWFDLWKQVRGTSWDLIVDLRRSAIPYLVRAKDRRTLAPTDNSIHRVTFLPSIVDVKGPLPPALFVSPANTAAAQKYLPGDTPTLAIAPIAARPEKTWAMENFAMLAGKLTAPDGPCPGWRVAVLGAAEDEAPARVLLDAIPAERRIGVFGEPDLLTVHEVIKRCRVFIGNDSGLSHLAAAVGVPTLTMFGPTVPAHYAPWGPRAQVIQAPHNAMAQLSVEAVVAAVARILAKPL